MFLNEATARAKRRRSSRDNRRVIVKKSIMANICTFVSVSRSFNLFSAKSNPPRSIVLLWQWRQFVGRWWMGTSRHNKVLSSSPSVCGLSRGCFCKSLHTIDHTTVSLPSWLTHFSQFLAPREIPYPAGPLMIPLLPLFWIHQSGCVGGIGWAEWLVIFNWHSLEGAI